MYLHSTILAFHVLPAAHLPWVPQGSFITWEGSPLPLSPSPSLIIRRDRSLAVQSRSFPRSELSQWLTEGSPAGRSRLGQAASAEHLSTLSVPGSWGCCFPWLSNEMLCSRWREQTQIQITASLTKAPPGNVGNERGTGVSRSRSDRQD